MVKKSVIWTETAAKQRREIFYYWNIHNSSTDYSEKLLKAIKLRTSIIAKHPLIGKKTSLNEIREAAMGNFSIYYRVLRDKIVIMAFWDNRQNPESVNKFFK